MRTIKVIIIIFFLAILGIQFIPVNLDNPPTKGEIKAPANIQKILKRSCYDCHSNTTNYPWYSRIAPVSWLIESDVQNGRKHLNFSEWRLYEPRTKRKKLDEIKEEVRDDKMPLEIYIYLHPSAQLSVDDKIQINRWVDQQLGR